MENKLIKEIKNNVAYIWLNRPDKKNALDADIWFNLPSVIDEINVNKEANCIVLAGKGDSFSAGIDITMFMSGMNFNEDLSSTPEDRRELLQLVEKMQDAFTAIENSKIPVIALAHGFCIGGATNMLSACDIRLATKDAQFSIGETKLGLVADVGVLQRMPRFVSKSDVNELAYTGRRFDGAHAEKIRFVSSVYDNFDDLLDAGTKLAEEIASNSPRIVQATKESINLSREGQYINLIIKDNGVGFDEYSVKKGFGLKNIQIRSLEHAGNAKFAIDNGTKIEINLYLKD
jgi:enoyl-CoA hydratase